MGSVGDRQGAVIWDFDGTLVDSSERNFRVARRIIRDALGKDETDFSFLASRRSYEETVRRRPNWRELYIEDFRMSSEQADEVGALWTDYQRRDDTPSPFYAGLEDVLEELAHLPHGIFSQNCRLNIERSLDGRPVGRLFSAVVGYEEVCFSRQKPHPEGLLRCMAEMGLDGLGRGGGAAPGRVLFVGDQETDFECATNASDAIAAAGGATEFLSVGVLFAEHADTGHWDGGPDHMAETPAELHRLVVDLLY